MEKLNPGATQKRLMRKRANEKGTAEQQIVDMGQKTRAAESAKYNKENKKGEETFYKNLMKAFATKAAEKDNEAEEEEADE